MPYILNNHQRYWGVLGGGGGYKGSAENENDNPQDGHMPINDHEIPLK